MIGIHVGKNIEIYTTVRLNAYFYIIVNNNVNPYCLTKFDSNDILDQRLYEFVYGKYNHIRPHRANGGLTPYAARCRAA